MKIAIIVPMAEEAEFYRNHFHAEKKKCSDQLNSNIFLLTEMMFI